MRDPVEEKFAAHRRHFNFDRRLALAWTRDPKLQK
jgi:hypothetical protein